MSRPETTIYRSDHILGDVGELTPELYRSWGRTLGRLSLVKDNIAIGSDCRENSEAFKSALKEGFADVGVRVYDLGTIPHVATQFSLTLLNADGSAYVSGLGMPSTFNGLRWILPRSSLSYREQSQILQQGAMQGLPTVEGEPRETARYGSFLEDWITWHQQIWFDTPKIPLRVVVDPLHGPWSRLLRRALQVLFPVMVFEAIHDEPDPHGGGLVPHAQNRESVKQLAKEVDIRRADFGIAMDGETGCFSFCDNQGVSLSIHELSWLMLQSYATAISGERVLHTTTLPEVLLAEIRRLGGIPILSPISTSFSGQMQTTGAILGFDNTGRFFGRTCFGYYISFFAVCWLIDFIAQKRINLSDFRRAIPPCFATQELKTPWSEPKEIVKHLREKWNVKPEKTVDGFRFSGPNGHMNLREVHDYGQLTFQFEATTRQMLNQMVDEAAAALDGTELAPALTQACQV